MLELNPLIEEVKKSIYKEINRFLSISNIIYSFVSDEEDNEKSFYHTILDEKGPQISKLYEQLNISITQLHDLKKRLSEIVGLAYLDFNHILK